MRARATTSTPTRTRRPRTKAGFDTFVEASCMDWSDKASWPKERVDYVIGSDLIYQKSLVPLLSSVVMGTVKPGGKFLYVAPDTGRDGMDKFIEVMKEKGVKRLAVVTSIGAGDSENQAPFMFKVRNSPVCE